MAGADDYLIKPFSAKELRRRVAAHLELARTRKEAADIKERFVAELRDERARLTNLFMQAPAFMAVLHGPQHVFEMANSAYYQLVGHRDIIGKTVRDALPEIEGQASLRFSWMMSTERVSRSKVNDARCVQPEAGAPLEEAVPRSDLSADRRSRWRACRVF